MNKERLLNVYGCSECFEVQVKTVTPKIRGCKKSSFHNWVHLGEKGLNRYICAGCGIKVKTFEVPSEEGCGNGNKHSWEKV